MNYLTETIYVTFTHGLVYFLCGTVLALGITAAASRMSHSVWRRTLLVAAVFVFWMTLFVSADSGYRVWQSLPDAPEEAFSDTGPIAFLVMGWLPSAAIICIVDYIARCVLPRVSAKT